LLTNVTCDPADTTISFGLTPVEEIVIVLVETGVVDGVVGEELDELDPPQLAKKPTVTTKDARRNQEGNGPALSGGLYRNSRATAEATVVAVTSKADAGQQGRL
jgi:hypothetical protein